VTNKNRSMSKGEKNMKLFLAMLMSLCLGLVSVSATALVNVFLIAKQTVVTLPDGSGGSVDIPMWGFAEDVGGACFATTPITARQTSPACLNPVATVPGPRLDVGVDTELTISLTNMLIDEPVSIVIPGQKMPFSALNDNGPTWTDGTRGPAAGGGAGLRRVRSFGREADVNGGQIVYQWTNLTNTSFAAGSYIYHSGTHPQVQVQMGLYGAATGNAGLGLAYPGIAFNNEVILFYSEIDPVLHTAVASGVYGTTLTSTIDYAPQYFLINGKPFTDKASANVATGLTVGQASLLRMFNMGLENHGPVLQNLRMNLVAEDGRPYPYARNQYSAMLAAGKTKDAIISPSVAGTFAVYDGQLGLSNGGALMGGMLSYVEVGAAVP